LGVDNEPVAAADPPPFAPPVQTYTDPHGRQFDYVHVTHEGSNGLAIHFSAFFGKWGDAKPYRDQFRGYFHRLKMLGSEGVHDWLFLCDAYGTFGNGTYYTGEKGDFFVERAMRAIINEVRSAHGYQPAATVLLGSSMGATAALKFGLELDVAGILAIAPHIDLDICALRQNRQAEVAFIVPSGDVASPINYEFTRQVRRLVLDREPSRPLPRLLVQSCVDDAGVFNEQVTPLLDDWRAHGGTVYLDARPRGGHTSDFATKAMVLDALDCLMRGVPIDVLRYQHDPRFAGSITRAPLSHRMRRAASLARKRVLGH
jgi:pimeloyl-ACP methyl ester carboxylesterase